MKNSIINVSNLTKKYVTYKRGSGFKETVKSFFKREKVPVVAVDHISFEVEEGDIIGILGPNGAGKSTTIKMLAGTLYPTEGSIQVMGYDPCKNRTTYVKQMGAVFGQKSQLIWDIPPIDSFRMNKAIYGIPEQEYEERLSLLTELFDIQDIVMRPTRVLSLGERMKCEFIMAMLHSPKIVFLDEPTIGLDIIAKQTIRKFILEMNRRGTTFILTTHDLEDVEQLAKNVIIINHGKKVFDNSIDHLRLTLGAKKIVELTLATAQAKNSLSVPGVKVVEGDGQQKMKLEVDTNVITISGFMQELSKLTEFLDISIKELPMETIIGHIYREKEEK